MTRRNEWTDMFGDLPSCAVHDEPHKPALCPEDGVWHPVVCKPVVRDIGPGGINYGTHTLPEKFWTTRRAVA